jgi:hypothetical protein
MHKVMGQCQHVKSGHCNKCARTFGGVSGFVKRNGRILSRERHAVARFVREKNRALRESLRRHSLNA